MHVYVYIFIFACIYIYIYHTKCDDYLFWGVASYVSEMLRVFIYVYVRVCVCICVFCAFIHTYMY